MKQKTIELINRHGRRVSVVASRADELLATGQYQSAPIPKPEPTPEPKPKPEPEPESQAALPKPATRSKR